MLGRGLSETCIKRKLCGFSIGDGSKGSYVCNSKCRKHILKMQAICRKITQMQRQVVKMQGGTIQVLYSQNYEYGTPVFLRTAMLLSFLRLQHAHQIIAAPA